MLRLRDKQKKVAFFALRQNKKSHFMIVSCFRHNSEKTYDYTESKFRKSDASITGKNLVRIKYIEKSEIPENL